jgi:hypothetical protein
VEDLGNKYKISQKNLMESDHNERLSVGEGTVLNGSYDYALDSYGSE